MERLRKTICRISGIGMFFLMSASAMDNPLQVPLDGAVVPYNGLFYGMAAGTNGQMLVSENLSDWRVAAQVLPGNVPGPYELGYRNGLFFLHTSQGYAVSERPDKPFSDLRKMASPGGQMRLFQDKSGALFSVYRTLGSKKDGEIWLRRHISPWYIAGNSPTQLLDGRVSKWDSLDRANLGNPEIIDYRGNYHLLYAANNPSPRIGLREIGIAANERPLRLSNVDKLPEPVLARNVERLARTYSTLLPSGEYTAWTGRYTTGKPESDWNEVGFKLSGWRSGKGGFGFPFEVDGAQLHACRTKWNGDELWVRREFDLDQGDPKKPVLNLRHEGSVEVFLNGKKVYASTRPSPAYSNHDIALESEGLFLEKGNVLAVHTVSPPDAKYRFLDFGLFDAGGYPVEPTVYGPDFPRIITGPNGFEKWMVYRAWWNGVPGTGIDRIFFFDTEMVVDGPTTINTPGYHPSPAKPTFSTGFSGHGNVEEAEYWAFDGGSWVVENGELRQTEPQGEARAGLRQAPANNYLFETSFRIPSSGRGEVGVVAWSNGEQEMLVTIDLFRGMWAYQILPGNLAPKRFKLPPSFKLFENPEGKKDGGESIHRLRVMKNAERFEIMLDAFHLTLGGSIVSKLTKPGVPGLYCKNMAATFDGVVYTMGWDEHGKQIAGWGAAADGTPPTGDWKLHDPEGLEQRLHSTPGLAFKGDLLDQYEFTVNAETEIFENRKKQRYGILPVFSDRNNHLMAMIDTHARQLVVSGKLKGENIDPVVVPLRNRISRRHLYDRNTSYRDIAAWIYSLRSQSMISSLDIRWLEGEYDHLQQEYFVPVDDMLVRYARLKRDREPILWDDGRFVDADEPKPLAQKPGILNHIALRWETSRSIIGSHVGFGFYVSSSSVIDSTGKPVPSRTPGRNLGPGERVVDDTTESDTPSRPQETLVTVEAESSYFFRCVKLKDRVIIELNGRPMVEIEGEWPPSQVGLVTEGQPCYFNGMTLMHLMEE